MRGRKRERGEWEDRDDFLFRQTHCGSFIIFPRQLPRPPALSLPSLFPSLCVCIFLSVFHSISVCHSLYRSFTIPVWSSLFCQLFPLTLLISWFLSLHCLYPPAFLCVSACLMWKHGQIGVCVSVNVCTRLGVWCSASPNELSLAFSRVPGLDLLLLHSS